MLKMVPSSEPPSPRLPWYHSLGAQTTASLALQIILTVGLLTLALIPLGRQFSFGVLVDVGPAFVRLSPTGKIDEEQIKRHT